MKAKTLLLATVLCGAIGTNAQARYYDAKTGRFLSPDSLVQAPTDPQGLNRYAYVRNNPMVLTDPSGHSWLSKTMGKAGDWINKHQEFTGLSWQALDPLFGSAYLSSFPNGRAILAGQVVAAGSFGFGGTSVGWGAVSGQASSAYIARRTGGNMLSAAILGGLEGAAIGGVFSGISGTKAPWMVKGLGKSALSAGLAAAHGADAQGVWMAAGLMFGAEAASAYFTRTVGYGADPTPGIRLEFPNQEYPTGLDNFQPPIGFDVFGLNNGDGGIWHQGSVVMRGASAVPGMQAVSQLHDTWMNFQYVHKAPLFGNAVVSNFVTMPPALVASFAAQFSGPWAPALILSRP